MTVKTIDIHAGQPSLETLLRLVRAGDEVLLTDGETPLARLIPVVRSGPSRVPGLNRGAFWTSDDFDAPLPDEFWTGKG